MKKYIYIYTFFTLFCNMSNAQVVFGAEVSSTPSSVLEIVSSNRGVLLPAVNLVDLDVSTPVASPKNNLFVMNTNDITGRGLVYWDQNNSNWVLMQDYKRAYDYIYSLGVKVFFVGNNGSTIYISTTTAYSYYNLPMNTVVLNKGVYDSSKPGYIIPEDGVYEISAMWRGVTNARNAGYSIRIMKNSSAILSENMGSQTTGFQNISVSTLYSGKLNKDDVISYQLFYSVAGALINSFSSNITIKKLS